MMQLGRVGVWYPVDRLNGEQIKNFLATIERLGYEALWYPESRGYESMSIAAFLLGNSNKLKIGSSIANIYARDAFTSRRAMLTLNSLYGERFILGLGVSHAPMVQGLRGHTYEKPIPAMRAYLNALKKDQKDAETWPIVLAALRPMMLSLSAEMTFGAIPYNTIPAHTAAAKKILGPDKWLAVEQKVCLETDPVKARALGRKEMERYLALPNYRNSWLTMGFTATDFENGGSDRFIDGVLVWGDVVTVKRKLREHFDAGATHLCIQPVHADGDFAARDKILTSLADL